LMSAAVIVAVLIRFIFLEIFPKKSSPDD